MADRPTPIRAPLEAGALRRIFHALLTLAGWVVFGWWWWIVLHRVSRHEVRFTAIFIAVALVSIVAVTALWAFYNARRFRRRSRRIHVRPVTPDFSRDRVGRPVALPVTGRDMVEAPVVVVRLTESGKRYEPVRNLPGASLPGASPPAA